MVTVTCGRWRARISLGHKRVWSAMVHRASFSIQRHGPAAIAVGRQWEESSRVALTKISIRHSHVLFGRHGAAEVSLGHERKQATRVALAKITFRHAHVSIRRGWTAEVSLRQKWEQPSRVALTRVPIRRPAEVTVVQRQERTSGVAEVALRHWRAAIVHVAVRERRERPARVTIKRTSHGSVVAVPVVLTIPSVIPGRWGSAEVRFEPVWELQHERVL